MNNFYAVFMHYLVVYAQNIHVLSDYFSTYIRGFIQNTLRTNEKITGNSIVYWRYHKIDRILCTCPTSITIK